MGLDEDTVDLFEVHDAGLVTHGFDERAQAQVAGAAQETFARADDERQRFGQNLGAHLKNKKTPAASQRYDRNAVIWPQMWMPVRQTSSNRYDASSANFMTPIKSVTGNARSQP